MASKPGRILTQIRQNLRSYESKFAISLENKYLSIKNESQVLL
jgi:hypothetical protein